MLDIRYWVGNEVARTAKEGEAREKSGGRLRSDMPSASAHPR